MAARASDGPRVRVAALMVVDERIVLVRHRTDSSSYHLLPGGGVRYRETMEHALAREVREETGLEARLVRPLFISDTIDPRGPRHVVNLTFLAEIIGGEITDDPSDPRVEAVELLAPSELLSIDLRPPLASEIGRAVAEGIDTASARYLGSLFTEEHES